ncbi:MAG: hypothetical protein ACLQVK_24015 [Acidimicrobiales bacterium]
MAPLRSASLLVCVVFLSVLGLGVSRTPSSAAPAARVVTLELPRHNLFNAISVIDGRLVLYGPASPSPAQPSTSSTCSFAVVGPATLALSDARRGSCADPALFGRWVIPAISIDKDLPADGGGPSAVVRIAHLSSHAPGFALGPIVMSLPALAYGQTGPSWIYGDGDLWLYDWVNRFDLLRISATTGAVLQRLEVPKIQTPLLAFNDDGLWIAPSGESSGPLYRLTPGATSLSAVFDLGTDGFAWWLDASGGSVWLEATSRPPGEGTVWELRGSDAAPVWHVLTGALTDFVAGTRFWPSEMVGNGADGLWTSLLAPSRTQQRVVRLDPGTGKVEVVVTLASGYPLQLGPSSVLSWTATTYDGSLFLLDPSAGTLYRITAKGAQAKLNRPQRASVKLNVSRPLNAGRWPGVGLTAGG